MSGLRRIAHILLLTGAICALAACAPTQRPADETSINETGAPPIAGENANGIEVRWWFTDDTSGAVERALAPYTDEPVGLDESTRSALRASGVRILRVPIEDSGDVARSLGTLGSRKRTWLTPSGKWSEAYTGRTVGPSVPVMLGGRRVRLDHGTLRILARPWIARTLEGPLLRASFATQNRRPPPPPGEGYFASPTFEGPLDKGPILDPLAFTMTLDDAHAWFITCAAPDETWEVKKQTDETEEDVDEQADEKDDQPDGAPGQPLSFPDAMPGPPAMRPLTVGEVLLSLRPEETGGRTIKSVIMIVPRLPGAERLLP